MSYLETLVIKIGGIDRVLRFDQGADHEYEIKVEGSKNHIFHCYAMIWGALVSAYFRKGEPVDFTFEQVCDWADQLTENDYKSILEAYNKAHAFLNEIKIGKKEQTGKKKSQPNSTKRSVLK